jgi:hypothetical protein
MGGKMLNDLAGIQDMKNAESKGNQQYGKK